MRRSRRRRRRRFDDSPGDPLDGLVNLFDLGIVLAVAFLIAGLAAARPTPSQQQKRQQVPTPSQSAPAKGRGTAVGTVYRLGDGRLIYTKPGSDGP